MSGLTDQERRQLRVLKSVYDDPRMTGTWRRGECDRLVELGYAERHEAYPGVWIVAITPTGLAAADALDGADGVRAVTPQGPPRVSR